MENVTLHTFASPYRDITVNILHQMFYMHLWDNYINYAHPDGQATFHCEEEKVSIIDSKDE